MNSYRNKNTCQKSWVKLYLPEPAQRQISNDPVINKILAVESIDISVGTFLMEIMKSLEPNPKMKANEFTCDHFMKIIPNDNYDIKAVVRLRIMGFYHVLSAAFDYFNQHIRANINSIKNIDDVALLTCPGSTYAKLIDYAKKTLNLLMIDINKLDWNKQIDGCRIISDTFVNFLFPLTTKSGDNDLKSPYSDLYIELVSLNLKCYAKFIKIADTIKNQTLEFQDFMMDEKGALMMEYINIGSMLVKNDVNNHIYFPYFANAFTLNENLDGIEKHLNKNVANVRYSACHEMAIIFIKNNYAEKAVELSRKLVRYYRYLEHKSTLLQSFKNLIKERNPHGDNLFGLVAEYHRKKNDLEQTVYWYQEALQCEDNEKRKNLYKVMLENYKKLYAEAKPTKIEPQKESESLALTSTKELIKQSKQEKEEKQESIEIKPLIQSEVKQEIILVENKPLEQETKKETGEINANQEPHKANGDDTNNNNKLVAIAYPEPQRKKQNQQNKATAASHKKTEDSKKELKISAVSPVVNYSVFGETYKNKKIYPLRTNFMTKGRIVYYGYFDDQRAKAQIKYNNEAILNKHKGLINDNTEVVTKGPGVRMFKKYSKKRHRYEVCFKTAIHGKAEVGGNFRMWAHQVAVAEDGQKNKIYLYAFDKPHDHNTQGNEYNNT